jgi:hypothetical protein
MRLVIEAWDLRDPRLGDEQSQGRRRCGKCFTINEFRVGAWRAW